MVELQSFKSPQFVTKAMNCGLLFLSKYLPLLVLYKSHIYNIIK
ncbi:hypothetical protein BACINT_03567 [Bacteroides intestinalis DSM 17393]|uniref:Uncharacterized protein n=1 Tax=Bacteroides intestinalis DSM 17393 TaxID=471870 RepID=B3CBI0_9BACE|nr:hypothetical protein BACINT_03567 [Bacteroides intestinalis DSM 17393]